MQSVSAIRDGSPWMMNILFEFETNVQANPVKKAVVRIKRRR